MQSAEPQLIALHVLPGQREADTGFADLTVREATDEVGFWNELTLSTTNELLQLADSIPPAS